MKAGYARVSTKQTVDLQVDALKKAGCTTVYTEIGEEEGAAAAVLRGPARVSSPCLGSVASGRQTQCGARNLPSGGWIG